MGRNATSRPGRSFPLGSILCPEGVNFSVFSRSATLKASYRQQRTRGKAHQAAVRALVFKWTRIIFRCWKSYTPYDERIYLAALEKRGSSLVKLMSEIPA